MNNIENCLQNKIATSNGILQTILNAILDLYNEGNKVMSHKIVRQKCNLNDKNFPKSGYNSAISNAMRNSIQCGGRMINEYSVKKDFTIAFDGNATNLEIKSPRGTISKGIENRNILEQKKSPENKIEDLKEKNSTSNKNKIFLIPCSSGKILKEELENIPFEFNKLEFNNELGKYRKELLDILKKSEFNNTHTRDKKVTKNKKPVNKPINITNEFNLKRTSQAHKIYSKGNLYSSNSSDSINWAQREKEKVYIISALFGIIRADDFIPLYDLAMSDKLNGISSFTKKYWKGKLDIIIQKLLVSNLCVYNLLSKEYEGCIDKKIFKSLKEQEYLGIPEIDINESDRFNCLPKRGKFLKYKLDKI